jgi:hypothetical protein
MKSKRISKAERKKMDRWHKKRKDRLRKKFPEIHGKLLDYLTHSYDDGWLYVTLYFTDGTNFSLDFTVNEPAVVPKLIEYGKYVDGEYKNIRTYDHKEQD